MVLEHQKQKQSSEAEWKAAVKSLGTSVQNLMVVQHQVPEKLLPKVHELLYGLQGLQQRGHTMVKLQTEFVSAIERELSSGESGDA